MELEDARNAANAAAAQRIEALRERDALASDKATLGRHLDAANARLTAVGSSHPSKCEVLLLWCWRVLSSNLCRCALSCIPPGHVVLAGVHRHHRTAGTCARPGAVQIRSTPRSDLGLSRLPLLVAVPTWPLPEVQALLRPCFKKAACWSCTRQT
jgi:hypothetical protein